MYLEIEAVAREEDELVVKKVEKAVKKEVAAKAVVVMVEGGLVEVEKVEVEKEVGPDNNTVLNGRADMV